MNIIYVGVHNAKIIVSDLYFSLKLDKVLPFSLFTFIGKATNVASDLILSCYHKFFARTLVNFRERFVRRNDFREIS